MILVPCSSPQLSLSSVWEKQGHTDLQHRRGLRKEAQQQDNLQTVDKALWPVSECSPLLSLLARQCGSLARAQVPMSAVSPHRHATYVFPGDLKAQWAWKPAARLSDRHTFFAYSVERAIKERLSTARRLWATPCCHTQPTGPFIYIF